MSVVAIGMNHRSAPLGVLEAMTLPVDVQPKALAEISGSTVVNEAVLVSTCNRTEVYVHAERFHDAYHDVRDALGLVCGQDPASFAEHVYVHYDLDAVEHLFSVAAGLDSAVLGEHEILGQIKGAWERARLEGTTGSLLDPLFEHAVIAGKRVRTETAIGRRTASVSQAAVELVSERIPSLADARVLLVGAGEVGTGVAAALRRTGVASLVVTNRTPERAEAVAAPLDATVRPLDEMGAAIAEADVVISATGAPGVVIDRATVEAATGGRPVLFLDLAVPRDIEVGTADLPGVDLLVLGDLQAFANRGVEERRLEVASARAVVADQITEYQRAVHTVEISPLLGSLHRWGEAVRRGEVDRHASALASLDDAQREAVEAVTRGVVAKLLHPPSRRLKDSAGSRRGERLAESTRDLFDLT